MKHLATFFSLLGALCLSAPVTGWSDDHHHGGGGHSGGHSSGNWSGHSGGNWNGRSGGNWGGRSGGSYCRPSIGFGFRNYSSYGYYSPYSYYPGYSYYSAPIVDLSYSSSPGYGGYYRGDSRSANYDDDLAVDVQRALSRRGYYRGAIDGEVGAGTRGAIREYQYRNGLEVTGRIDRSLLRSLGVS